MDRFFGWVWAQVWLYLALDLMVGAVRARRWSAAAGVKGATLDG